MKRFWSVVLLFVWLCSLSGVSVQAQSVRLPVEIAAPEQVLLFSVQADTPRLVGRTAENGVYPAADPIPFPVFLACENEDVFMLLQTYENRLYVQRIDGANGTEQLFYATEIPADDVCAAGVDRFGRLYVLRYSSPQQVQVFDALGSPETPLTFSAQAAALQVLGDTLFLKQNGAVTAVPLSQTGAEIDQMTTYTVNLAQMLTESVYLGQDGTVYTLSGTALAQLEQALESPLVSVAGTTVYRCTDGKTVLRTQNGITLQATVQGKVLALWQNYALVQDAQGLACVPLTDFRDISGGDTPNAPQTVGAWLYVSSGTTCASLRKSLQTEARFFFGTQEISSGALKTGMTVAIGETRSTLILPGDLNGTGTVNSADLRALQRHLLGTQTLSEAEQLAADLNRDGTLTAADLVLLSGQMGS